LPNEELRIEGNELDYEAGRKINLICISGASKPTANLSWFINDRKVLQTLTDADSIQKANSFFFPCLISLNLGSRH